MSNLKNTRADQQEVENFQTIAQQWWDLNGPFKALHSMNEPRIEFIQKNIQKILSNPILSNKKILDAGCGGGILTEALYQLHPQEIIGIDAGEKIIQVAQQHAQQKNFDIHYQSTLLEDMDSKYTEYFDIVCSLEVVEHVPDLPGFINGLKHKLKIGGLVFLSTINRNLSSILLAKYAAEYVFNLAPKGAHDWRKFVKPSELSHLLKQEGFQIKAIEGLKFNPLKNTWKLCREPRMNYILCAQLK